MIGLQHSKWFDKYNHKCFFFSDAGPDIRWVGNEQGLAGETNWNTITPDTLYPGKADIGNLLSTGSENGTRWIPAEVDVSIRLRDGFIIKGRFVGEISRTSFRNLSYPRWEEVRC